MDAFAQALQSYLQTSQALRQRSASEDSLRDAFLHFLRQAFPRLSHTETLELEKYIPALRVRGGFADVIYEDLIFEFKRHLDETTIQQARTQLERYLCNQPHPERFFGMLTDGLKFQVYAWRQEGLNFIDSLDLAEITTEIPGKIAQVRLWLDAYLFHERAVMPTTDDLVRRFGEHSPTFHQGRRLLEKLWQEVQSHSTARTKFAEWQNLLSLVYGSEVGDTDLFLRHTYLALLARVLVQVVLGPSPSEPEDPASLLSGKSFQQKGLENFGEADFFVWMEPHHPDIQAFVRALALRLRSTYDLSRISEDLLKGLYQELVDPKTRHDLGEFYTPDWLAELTLREVGFPEAEKPSLLDPACGSGTFLFTAIRLRSQKLQGASLVEWATSHLAGLEVHPLAVFIARTNFLLALKDHLKHYRKRLHIPIYMADALSLPEKEIDRGALRISVPVDAIIQSTGKDPFSLSPFFELPVELARSPEKFSQALSALMDFARPDLPEEAARTGLEARLKEILHPAAADLSPWQRNLRLMRWLLKEPPTDSVWGFILSNASQPALLAHRQFDFVAGNPPWLAYRYVQRPDYQKRLKDLAIKTYQLLESRQTHLFTQMELATLFLAVCERHYLREGGTLAFVMPRSILTGAKQHAAFQKRYLARTHHILDCERVSPLFNVPTCVVIYRKGSAPPAPTVPVTRWAGTLPTHNASYPEALKHLRRSETTFTLPTPRGESPYLKKVTQGATIVPRTFWFVRPAENVIAQDETRPELETDPRIQPQAKAPWKGLSLRGAVEAHYLYATLLSDDLLPFGWRNLSLIVLPLHEGRLLSSEEAIARGHTGLANWLAKAERHWKENSKTSGRIKSIYDRLDYERCLTKQTPVGPYKLLYNTSGTHLCACVIDTGAIASQRLHDLPVQGFVADTTTYWLETENREEAHYLCAILNSPFVDEYIKPFQTKGSFGATSGKGERHIHRRPFELLPIPQYDGKDEGHRRLAELSRACHEKGAAFMKGMRGEEDEDRKPRIGTLRQKVREMLREELQEIEKLTRGLLAVEKVSPLASEAPPGLFAGAEGEITS